jgi:hypothetical protein
MNSTIGLTNLLKSNRVQKMKKIFLLTLLCLVLVGCAPAASVSGPTLGTSPSPAPATPAPVTGVPNLDHIVLIMLENRDYKTVIGPNSQMPLLNTLAQQEVLLSNYFAVTHPSLPNYISLVSGSTQGITSDCNTCFVNQPNLADLIEASGRNWKSYEESMPSACFIGDANPYVQKHNPFLYFNSIRLNPARCDRSIVPLTTLETDLANNQLPNFSFIMPNLCNSGHDCSAATADKWVTDMVAKLQASPALGINSLIIIAFDEGSDKSIAGCCGLGSPAGGQVAVVLVSPTTLPEFTDNTPYSHYSLLKTILTAWNLPALGMTTQGSIQAITAPWTGILGRSSTNVPAGVSTPSAPTGNIVFPRFHIENFTNTSPALVGCISSFAIPRWFN